MSENSTIQKDSTVWLNQSEIATLFDKGRTTINEYIKNIFQGKELNPQVVYWKFRHTTQHGEIQGKTQTQEIFGNDISHRF